MILYQAISSYQLLCMAVHRLSVNRRTPCVLLAADWIRSKVPDWQRLRSFFDDVVLYDANIRPSVSGFYTPENDRRIESLLKDKGILLEEAEEIHVAGAQFLFGAYLAVHGIPCVYWEEAPGLLSRKEVLRDNEKAWPEKQKFCESLGLYGGTGPNVRRRVANLNVQAPGFQDSLAEHFDVSAELAALPEETRAELISVFRAGDRIDIPEQSAVFLTQHFANIPLMSFEEQALLYQLVLDYFFAGRPLVIKPHPDDLMYYGLLFPDLPVLRERFPSEFLPFLFTRRPETIATVSSTGIYALRPLFQKSFSFDFCFQKHFKDIHRYYAIVLLAVRLGHTLEDSECLGMDMELAKNLFDLVRREEPLSGEKAASRLLLVDRLENAEGMSREKLIRMAAEFPEDGVMLFANTGSDFCFHSYEERGIWNSVTPLCLRKRRLTPPDRISEEFFSDLETETIYFFSKSRRLTDMAEKFSFGRELKYTGIHVSLDQMTPQERRIKILEGILAATEERLLYYKAKAEENGRSSA